MTYPLSPSASPDLASTITGLAPDAAVLRIGVVTSYSSTNVTVAISGSDTLVEASYLFGVYEAVLGDNVAVLKQGSQWIVLGAASARPEGNMLTNGYFDMDVLDTSPPTAWGFSNDGAAVPAVVTFAERPIDGPQACRVNGAGTAAQYFHLLYSEAISVTPGDVISASAYTTWFDNGTGFQTIVSLWLLWYTSPGAIPVPADTSASTATMLDTVTTHPGNHPGWVLLRQQQAGTGAVAPEGMTTMRVAFLVDAPAGDIDVDFGRVVVRRISGGTVAV